MKRAHRLCVASLLAIHTILLADGAWVHGPVMDDIAHLAAGVSNWELGRFDLYKVNPPLVRMVAALPVLAAGAETDYHSYSQRSDIRAEFSVMYDFTDANGPRVIWLVTLARWGLIPLALVGGYMCYRWARELYGDRAGIVALVLWCFCPNVLAYAQILTADAGAAALGVAAGYFFWKWLRDPAWDRAVAAGIALGLAELTKTTWVLLFGLWPLLWFVVRCPWSVGSCPKSEKGSGFWVRGSEDKAEDKRQKAEAETVKTPNLCLKNSPPNPRSRRFWYEVAQLVMVLALAVVSINAGYDFEGSGTKLRNYLFVSRPLTRAAEGSGAYLGNRFAKTWLGRLPVPLPKSYVEGIDLQWQDIEAGKPSYLRGQWKERGWWYWYLYALAVKVPLGTWGLFFLAVGVRAARCSPKFKVQRPKAGAEEGNAKCKMQNANRKMGLGQEVTWRDELVLLAPVVVVLVLVSSQTGFSRYIRYVLPMLPFVFIWISSVVPRVGSLSWNASEGFPCRIGLSLATIAALLLAWSVGNSLWYAPHWMSYFNELAGGPTGGPAHLIDAQVDWGQDLLYLKKWLHAHPEAQPLGLVYFGPINPSVAGVDFVVPPKGTVTGNDRNEVARLPGHLEPGWYAVSVNYLYGYDHFIYAPSGSREWVTRPYYSYFRRSQPVAMAGYSIYIYHLTAGEIDKALRDQSRQVDGRQ